MSRSVTQHPPQTQTQIRTPSLVTRDDVARHPIRRAARHSGLHPQTLRDYERRGLLQPDRTDGGMRLYRDRDIALARRIRALTEEGYGLPAIERVLGLERRIGLLIERVRVLEDQNMRLSARLQAAS